MGAVQPKGCCCCGEKVAAHRNAPDGRPSDQPIIVEEVFAKEESDPACQDAALFDGGVSRAGGGSSATCDDNVSGATVTAGNLHIDIFESDAHRDQVPASPPTPGTPSTPGRKSSTSRLSLYGESDVTQCLQHARDRARMRQICWRLPLVLGGSVMFCVGIVLDLARSSVYTTESIVAICTTLVGAYIGILGLLPTDSRAIPIFATWIGCPFELLFLLSVCSLAWKHLKMVQSRRCSALDESVPCWLIVGNFASCVIDVLVNGVLFARLLTALIRRALPRVQLYLLWSLFGGTCFCIGATNVLMALASLALWRLDLAWSQGVTGCAEAAIGFLSIIGTGFRDRVQLWFMSRGEAAFAAAGVAELLGDRSIDHVLVAARSTFSFVPVDRVLLQDMKDNHPNPDLAILTEKGHLGSVDAFVSHSWHDDPDAKWALLQEYREEFKQAHGGREPKLWIDKYCINQSQIDESLACLPVYLFGCRTLLILCGKTYLKRLWCLIELFVFMQMGGDYSKLDVRMLRDLEEDLKFAGLGSADISASVPFSSRTANSAMFPARVSGIGHNLTDEKTLKQIVTSFDPRAARCFNDYDNERLHAVIQATGYDQIRNLVQDVFLGAFKGHSDRNIIGRGHGPHRPSEDDGIIMPSITPVS